MYRKARKEPSGNVLDAESLMDILTCVVGVMIFIVLIAVLDAQGVGFNMFTPIAENPSAESERKVFLCKSGRIRLLDVDGSIHRMLGDARITYNSVPAVVEAANQKNISDGYFSYQLDYDSWEEGSYRFRRSISVVVNEREGISGETVDDLEKPSSRYTKLLDELDPDSAWFAFAVDKESLDVFRKARDIAIQKGFAIGWDPSTIEFPLREVIFGGGNRYNPNHPGQILSTRQFRAGG